MFPVVEIERARAEADHCVIFASSGEFDHWILRYASHGCRSFHTRYR